MTPLTAVPASSPATTPATTPHKFTAKELVYIPSELENLDSSSVFGWSERIQNPWILFDGTLSAQERSRAESIIRRYRYVPASDPAHVDDLFAEFQKQFPAEKPKFTKAVKLPTIGELRQRIATEKAAEQLVGGFLPSSGPNILCGDSNIGKSPLVYQLGVCVATGTPFLEKPTKQGRVLMVDFENHDGPSVCDAVAKAVGATDWEQNLTIVTPAEVRDMPEICRTRVDGKFDLVIVDSLRWILKNEKDQSDCMDLYKQATKAGGCWLFVHHLKKNQGEERIPLIAESDVLFWLQNAAGSLALINQAVNRIAVDSRKAKADLVMRVSVKLQEEQPAMHLSRIFDRTMDPLGYELAKGADLLTPAQQELLRKLEPGKAYTFTDVLQVNGGHQKGTVSKFIKAALKNGLAKQTSPGQFEFSLGSLQPDVPI